MSDFDGPHAAGGRGLATTMAVEHCGHLPIGGYSQGAMVSDGPAPAGGDDMFGIAHPSRSGLRRPTCRP